MTKENQFAPDGGVVRSKSSGQSLRQQAEKAVGIAEKLETLPPEEMSRVLHELRVHQIELEMQNEELRRTQKALDASQQRYFDLYYLTPVGYLIVSKQGLVIEANLTATYLLGAVRRELFKQRISRFILKDDQGIYYRKRKDLFESGTQQKCELRMVKKDTTSFWVQLVLAVAIDKGGAPLCRIVLNDITERKLAEEELLKEHNLIANIMETSPVGIVTLNSGGKIVFANSRAIAILGLSKDSICQTYYNSPTWSISDLDGKPFPDDRLPFYRVMSTGMTVFDVQHAIQWPDGKRILLSINGSPMIDTNGQLTGMVASIEDITKRKQAEKLLEDTLNSLRKAVVTTIHAMSSAAESRDPYTAGHQIRSAGLARAIATEMNLAQDKIDGIYLASSIHDIGKLSIPAEILSKPAKLSDLEFALIKEHAQKGYEILKDVESPWPLAEIAYQHHERMDGSGYPRALKGNDILLEARILNVADVVEAMASHRPYRPSLGIDAALEEIEKNKGTFYDEAVGDACLRLFREKGFKLEVA